MTAEDELPRFERFLNAIPDKLDYNHPDDLKGQSAGKILATMAGSASTFASLLKTGEVDFAKVDWASFSTLESIKTSFMGGLKSAIETTKSMSEEEWDKEAKMLMNGEVVWAIPLPFMMISLLNDLVHHRGQ